MVSKMSESREFPAASLKSALIRSFAGVDSYVSVKVSLLGEGLVTTGISTQERTLSCLLVSYRRSYVNAFMNFQTADARVGFSTGWTDIRLVLRVS